MNLELIRQYRPTCTIKPCLSEYEFHEVYRVGIKHQVTDAVSSLQTTGKDEIYLDDDLPILAINEQESGEQDIHIIII